MEKRQPSKWDLWKKRGRDIRDYLKYGGKVIAKGNPYTPKPIVSVSKFDDPEFTKKHRQRRKKLKKISYKSRRKNRSGL